MARIRTLLVAVLLVAALATTLGAGSAQAKKRKTVRVPVQISLLHTVNRGLDRFFGTTTAAFPRCAQFGQVFLTQGSGSSAFGPFTPQVQLIGVTSDAGGPYQVFYEPFYLRPLNVHRYVAQTVERTFKTRRKTVVCKAGFSLPVIAVEP